MINVCSAAANKILKKLNEDKDLLLSNEGQNATYSRYLSEDEASVVIPDYDFKATQKALEEIDAKIIVVKHAINMFNASTEIMPGMTIDAALSGVRYEGMPYFSISTSSATIRTSHSA